ncbi:MAG: intradiol ring-cleavage dioxygenase [Saprospiraceae bacterium]
MIKRLSFLSLILFLNACQTSTEEKTIPKFETNQIVGGPCEGCEAIFEYGDKALRAVDTLPQFQSTTPKLKITGTVYQINGHTPAEGVILYVYHTNRNGLYEHQPNATGWAKRHGEFRGWIKTGKDGRYTFYTFQPAAYPSGREAAHIHLTVKEPKKNAYFLDGYIFEADPLLTEVRRNGLANRGGSGILRLKKTGSLWTAKRDLILGLNIPNYPIATD